MKIVNITNKSIKPVTVSVMVQVKGENKRFDLKPGESIYSNGTFQSLFNQSLRVQKQRGLIDVTDENDLIQMEKDKKEAEEAEVLKEVLRKQLEEEKIAVLNLSGSAFDNSDLLPEEPKIPLHPDLLIVDTKKQVDYSLNIIPDIEEKPIEESVKIEEFPIYTPKNLSDEELKRREEEVKKGNEGIIPKFIKDKIKEATSKKNKNEKNKK